MKLKIFSFLIAILFFQNLFASNNDSIQYKHRWFDYWGYNREYYSLSNIHLKGNFYDLTFYQVKAKDKPYPFNLKNYVDPTSMWVPQYNYRLGFQWSEKISFSLGLDHMKYIAEQGQITNVTGSISSQANLPNQTKYPTNFSSTPMQFTGDFLFLKHTNGLNLISCDIEYKTKLSSKHFIKINLNSGFGLAAIVTKTQVTLEGYGQDNNFHLCGYGASTYQGLEFVFGKYFFLRPQFRLGWLNLTGFLINGKSDTGRGYQNFSFTEGMLAAGSYFQLHCHKKK